MCLNKNSFSQDMSEGKITQFNYTKELSGGTQIQKGPPSPLQTTLWAAIE